MFRADTRVVKASRDRMTFLDLPVIVLEQIGTVAVQYARRAGRDRGTVLVALQALAAGFNADNLDVLIIEERMKDADRIRAAADGSNDEIRQTAFGLKDLLLGFRADDGLEIADHFRIGMR